MTGLYHLQLSRRGRLVLVTKLQRTILTVVKDKNDRFPSLPDDLAGLTSVPYSGRNDAQAQNDIEEWIQREFFPESSDDKALSMRNGKRYTWDDIAAGVNHIRHLLGQDAFKPMVLIQGVTSSYHCDYYAYLERGTLESPSGQSLLPWHGPQSKTFLAPAR